jgi:molybdopterin-guanine dinucleotide biosynthesis protein B
MHELRGSPEPRLAELLTKMSPVDLVIVEGYKTDAYCKIEVYRSANGKPLLFPNDRAIAGIAADEKIATDLPQAHLDDISAVAAIVQRCAVSVADVVDRERARV